MDVQGFFANILSSQFSCVPRPFFQNHSEYSTIPESLSAMEYDGSNQKYLSNEMKTPTRLKVSNTPIGLFISFVPQEEYLVISKLAQV